MNKLSINKTKKGSLVFVVSGPSGSGKSTLVEKLLNEPRAAGILSRSVSVTTRPKRSGERSGRHYFFLSDRQFKSKLASQKILEWTKYSGYYYGTPLDYVQGRIKRRKNLVLCLDFKGARALKRLYPQQVVTIFILPPSINELKKRIGGRCCKTTTLEIKKRIRLAGKEMAQAAKYDYRVKNSDLNKAVKRLMEIILKSLNIN